MRLAVASDFDNLYKYSNVDFSTVTFHYSTREIISKFDVVKLSAFIDIFDDVNKMDYYGNFDTSLPLAGIIISIIYSEHFICTLTDNQKMKILFKLTQKGFTKSLLDSDCVRRIHFVDNLYVDHKMYVTKYYDTITNLFRLTNSDTIDICKLNDSVIDTIKMLLLIAKTRVIPKYIILHKILLFYLGSITC